MADLNARTRLLIGTTADWAAHNLVIGSGELVVERAAAGAIKMKVGDGVALYSALPFVTATPTIPPEYVTDAEGDARYVLVSGTSAVPAGNLVPRMGADGKLNAGMIPLPPSVTTSAGAADAGKLVALSSDGRISPTMISITTGTYRGTADATAAVPAGTYLAGDYFINTGTGLVHASWGAPGGTTVAPSNQVVYNGAAWQVIAASSAYLPLTGGTLAGPGNLTVGGALQVNGNSGIGAAPGSSRLTVSGSNGIRVEGNGAPGYNIASFVNDAGTNLSVGVSGSTAAGWSLGLAHLGTVGAAPLAFGTNATEQMRIAVDGNVGIGTSTPTSVGPTIRALTLNGSGGAMLDLAGGGTSFGRLYADTNQFLVQALGPTPFIGFHTNSAERMRIDAAGNVGIGTSAFALAAGGRTILGLDGSAGMAIEFRNSGSTYGYILSTSSQTTLTTRTPLPLNFGTNDAVRMTISAAGVIQDGLGQELGYRSLYRAVYGSGDSTLQASDNGRAHYKQPTGNVIVPNTLPDNALITIYNASANTITIVQGAGATLALAGTSLSGNRLLATQGIATVWIQGAPGAQTAIISGTGLS